MNATPPPPLPRITPKRRRSSRERVCESSRASAEAAASAIGTVHGTWGNSFRKIQHTASKSRISPAILQSSSFVGKAEIGPVPLFPSSLRSMPEKTPLFPVPLGFRQPSPVITTDCQPMHCLPDDISYFNSFFRFFSAFFSFMVLAGFFLTSFFAFLSLLRSCRHR